MIRAILLACFFYNSLLIGSAEGDCSPDSPQSCADPTTLLQMKAQTDVVEDNDEEMLEHEDDTDDDTETDDDTNDEDETDDDTNDDGSRHRPPPIVGGYSYQPMQRFNFPPAPPPSGTAEDQSACMTCLTNILSNKGHRRRACKQIGVNRRRSSAQSCGNPSHYSNRRRWASAKCYEEMEDTCKTTCKACFDGSVCQLGNICQSWKDANCGFGQVYWCPCPYTPPSSPSYGLLERQNRTNEKTKAADQKVDGQDATAELEKAALDSSLQQKCG